MTPELFAKHWVLGKDKLINFSNEIVDELKLIGTTSAFLKLGIPEEAAPFLNFGSSFGANLESASIIFNIEPEFNIYRIIGFNAYGDPICINTQNENIVYLNHDDNFGWVYINKSLEAFLESLLLYRDLIQYISTHSKLESRKMAYRTKNRLLEIDKKSFNDSFWEIEFSEVFENLTFKEIIKSLFKIPT